ncbi:MAG: glycogen synthase GlgA [Clostridiales bacterium]|nr:glycogen synthase GlgA [Clostridiales bacterium]
MRVLLVASEASPFIKSGGLGDVMGALPKELSKNGLEVAVVIPKYKGINYELKNKLEFQKWFMVEVGWRRKYCGVLKYYQDGVTYYLLDNEAYFDRDGLYGYYDDAERFAFFDRAVLKLLRQIDWRPDVIHCNDWQTGMIPVLLTLEYAKYDEFYRGIKTVYSIHNLLFQGVFDPKILPELFGYDMEPYLNKSLEFDKGVSFMKGGINYSDKISTVSYTYANEFRTPEYGERLDGLLRERGYAIRGILNGIDYEEYNPQTDPYIYHQFGSDPYEAKRKNKIQLQKDLGLYQKEDTPIIGLISRLTRQKGIDLVLYMIDRLLYDRDVQFVVVGNGDRDYEEAFWRLKDRWGDKISTNIRFDNNLAHKVYAASDLFMMPSKFEPCGLGQLIALRYGTIPIVRETGGLKDTVVPYNEFNGIGNGFSFRNFNGDELYNITDYALNIYWDKWKWNGIINQAMNSNNSWEKSAREYEKLYKEALCWY